MPVKEKKEKNTNGEAQGQKQRKHDTPPHRNHQRPHANGHGPKRNKGMANKYVTSPCTPYIPRYMCVGEETKYVVKEGAKGTTPHTRAKSDTTAHVVKHAYIHEPRP